MYWIILSKVGRSGGGGAEGGGAAVLGGGGDEQPYGINSTISGRRSLALAGRVSPRSPVSPDPGKEGEGG